MSELESISQVVNDPPPYELLDSIDSSKRQGSQIVPMGDKEVDSSLDESDFEDETIIERIIGLGEMFPDSMRNITFSLVNMTYTGLKLEIMQTEEQDAVQQRTMMLGPKAAGGSGLSGFSASIPHLVESK